MSAIKWDGKHAEHRGCLMCVFGARDGWSYVVMQMGPGRHDSDGPYVTDETAKSAAEKVVLGWLEKGAGDE